MASTQQEQRDLRGDDFLFASRLDRGLAKIRSQTIRGALQTTLRQELAAAPNATSNVMKTATDIAEYIGERSSFERRLIEAYRHQQPMPTSLAEWKTLVDEFDAQVGWVEKAENVLSSAGETGILQASSEFSAREVELIVATTAAAYGFTKGLATGIWDLVMTVVSLITEPAARQQLLELAKKVGFWTYRIYLGSPQEQMQAAEELRKCAEELFTHIIDSFLKEWEIAKDQGREVELIERWVASFGLEAVTIWLSVAKVGKVAEGASFAKTMRTAEQAQILKYSSFVGRRTSIALAKELFPGQSAKFYRDFAKVKGRVKAVHDRFLPGPLHQQRKPKKRGKNGWKESQADTFSGMKYVEIEVDKPTFAYRTWMEGGTSELGGYWTPFAPKGSMASKIDSAVIPEWSSIVLEETAKGDKKRWVVGDHNRLTVLEIPKGTTVHMGISAPRNDVWVGQNVQMVLKPKAEWIKGSRTIP